ncbi:FISUMP domain-containing protein [Winogradskyella sp. A2]|uniref:FISUMP domain-containing protein n=1 Tax=Winogradskyella sp. A2 TaxID=3366944 RepID=UPI00398C2F62
MKKIILLAIFSILVFNLNAQEKRYYYDSGKLQAIKNYSNGKLDGAQKEYYENGRLKSISNNSNGEINGLFKMYYENGQLSSIINMLNTKEHGKEMAYSENGVLERENNYSYGNLHGECKIYRINGELERIQNYSNGKLDGVQKYFYEKGKPPTIVNYLNGIRHGEFINYYLNGNMSESGIFYRGKKTGEWKVYDKSGQLYYIGNYIDGKKTGLWKFFNESGRLSRTGTYSNGELIGEWEEYPYIETDVNTSKSVNIDKQESMTENHIDYNADANAFKSVKIGHQVWMSKNLNVSKFRNGDPIPHAKTKEAWDKAGDTYSPAWCYYENESNNGEILGKLYNWYAVNDERGLAPLGWHIPSDDEWTELTDNLGGVDKAGIKMKSMSMWDDYNNIREKGVFEALPGGKRLRGRFSNGGTKGVSTSWWSSTEFWTRSLFYVREGVNREYGGMRTGISVRCIKD